MSDSSPSSADVEAIEEFPEDPRLRVMRRLVNTLLVIMIGGFLAVVIAIIWGLKVQMRAIEAQPAIRGLQSDERIMSATATAVHQHQKILPCVPTMLRATTIDDKRQADYLLLTTNRCDISRMNS